MTNFARLTNKIQGMYEGKQEFIDSLNDYTLLIIDDLGAERKSEFMQEMVFNIIDSRYRSGLPFIITTNLTSDEIKKPQEVSYQRIYDRILERCFPIEINGVSRRRTTLKDTHADTKAMLGL
jgi:DNA replication protein DnaC